MTKSDEMDAFAYAVLSKSRNRRQARRDPDAGHTLQIERPRAFNEGVLECLRQPGATS